MNLTNAPVIARGSQRICYQHPTDPTKCIKINIDATGKQQKREQTYFQKLTRRQIPFRHLAVYYGTTDTQQGVGLVFEHIRDYDGSRSISLDTYIRSNGMHQVPIALEAMKAHFSRWNIITCDMSLKNFLVRRVSSEAVELVMIDGIGNREAIPLSSYVSTLGRIKMKRRWKRFDAKLQAFAGGTSPV